ncbi:hypothetical protein POVWA2_041940 [Plasmodium ovale wallikeri]|uniref:Uncharacterized protein n=1 Tax=Plasmodium ovale wallikeri TaxID=864142 RepID=A0A1A8ZCA9_PLAOA|nr:hypothetical protein POVWA1_043470 [Plasmodium ovale wallikeri]SBT41487.1 hypothetical protein POVWA2_041940 [Plasmodium ovale wallikeri]
MVFSVTQAVNTIGNGSYVTCNKRNGNFPKKRKLEKKENGKKENWKREKVWKNKKVSLDKELSNKWEKE